MVTSHMKESRHSRTHQETSRTPARRERDNVTEEQVPSHMCLTGLMNKSRHERESVAWVYFVTYVNAPHMYISLYMSVCCSVLQRVAVCCSVLQCLASYVYLVIYVNDSHTQIS